MYQLNPLFESINNDNDYDSALKIFNSLSEEDKWKLCPWHGRYKNVPVLYRHVITNKGFVDIYPYNHSKKVGFLLIAVAPKYRGKGVTYDLMKECFKDCKTLGIKKIWWVCANSNTDSLHAGLKNGFKLQKKGKTETRLYKDL